MKFVFMLGAVAAFERAISNQEFLEEIMMLQEPIPGYPSGVPAGCPPPLEISEDNLHYQLGEFSRNFQTENWVNAMHIKDQLAAGGVAPKFAVTTKELYDKSFSFPKVRNYDYAVQNMNDLEAVEDNLNQNLDNDLALHRFIDTAKKVRENLNAKYDIGFIDPGVDGDWQ